MKTKDKVFIGLLGAAAVGVAIGLLFYTEEGKKTRKKMKNTARDWADSFGSLVTTGKENLSDISRKAKKEYSKLKNKSAEQYNDVSDELADSIS